MDEDKKDKEEIKKRIRVSLDENSLECDKADLAEQEDDKQSIDNDAGNNTKNAEQENKFIVTDSKKLKEMVKKRKNNKKNYQNYLKEQEEKELEKEEIKILPEQKTAKNNVVDFWGDLFGWMSI